MDPCLSGRVLTVLAILITAARISIPFCVFSFNGTHRQTLCRLHACKICITSTPETRRQFNVGKNVDNSGSVWPNPIMYHLHTGCFTTIRRMNFRSIERFYLIFSTDVYALIFFQVFLILGLWIQKIKSLICLHIFF